MWEDDKGFPDQLSLPCSFLVHEHDAFDTVTICLSEEAQRLRDDVSRAYGDIYRRDELTLLIYEDERHFCTRFFPIKTDIMTS
jgi:hypothetical protein